jgi:hypothetical protein
MVKKLALVATLACALGAAVTSCTLFDDDPPDDSCDTDADCFRAQGEVCNLQTHRCQVRADAGVDAP